MPLYYFNQTDNGRTIEDHEGSDLASPEAARQEALAILGQRAHDELPDGDHRIFAVELLNDARKPILTANLSLMVTYSAAWQRQLKAV